MISALSCLFFLALGMMSAPCQAKVQLSETTPVPIPQSEVNNGLTSKDVQEIVPLDMHSSDDTGYITSKIGDRALQNWWNSPAMRNSALGQTATTVEKNLKTEVNVKSNDPNKVDHKFSFQVQALQATTVMKYSGWVNGQMSYDARAGESRVELSEKILQNKDLVLSHTASALQDTSALGVRWNF